MYIYIDIYREKYIYTNIHIRILCFHEPGVRAEKLESFELPDTHSENVRALANFLH